MPALLSTQVKNWPRFLAVQHSRYASMAVNVSRDQTAPVKPFKDIPGPGGLYRWPVIGTMLHFKPFTEYNAETIRGLFDSLHKRYGTILKVRLGEMTVMTSDPKDFETVFRNEGRWPVRPPVDIDVVYIKRNNLKENLASVQGEAWQKLRTPMNKRLMKADSAHHYIEAQNVVADEFVHILSTKELDAEEMADYFFRYASESIGVVTFNTRLGFFNKSDGGESDEFLHASKEQFRIINDTFSGKSVLYKLFRDKTYRRYEKAMNVIIKHADKHTSKAKESIQSKLADGSLHPDDPNLLFSLMAEKSLTTEDISFLATSLYSGGTDSTARNLQSFFHILAMNPDKQELLRAEALDIVGKDRPLTAKNLTAMPYLKACVKECFRINYPTASGTFRYLPTDVVLSGYTVPAGVPIVLQNPIACMEHFENPGQFLPERWLRTPDRRKQENIVNMVLLPFSYGPRNCPGQRFALQEIYLAAVKPG
ncbi:probable cytochrome P450 12d1 proximal, mitochondrial isoform X2 [Physella acuta]|uniref:probable cytochrome P450 12d1 proximal, mitochondrial isoform X2 n=1 Tax=Physella acuta TaxID=109671 RepID=UPI0027DADD23|nr:probable cytochrome P450 12d1 proximal, mitochondrial isoform X2 [Physella acuta]